MRIAFLGTAPIARPILRALVLAGHDIAAVVTQPDRPQGRSKRAIPPPVKEEALALDLGARVLQPERMRKPEARADLEARGPFDLGVVCAYGQILPQTVLDLPRRGMINVHASLLPRWRGAAPVQHAILAGDAETGVTIMRMVLALDAGPTIAKTSTILGFDDTAEMVLERLSHLGAELLLKVLVPVFTNTAVEAHQDDHLVTYAPPIRKEEGQLDWTASAIAIDRHVRAMAPWPGSYTHFHRVGRAPERIAILRGRPGTRSPGAVPARAGNVLAVDDGAVRVACGVDEAFDIAMVHPAGKRPMGVADWLRGRAVGIGDLFGMNGGPAA